MPDMTKLEIITRREKLGELKEELKNIGVTGMTVSNAYGVGAEMGQSSEYFDPDVKVNLLPKIKVEIVVCTVPVDEVVNAAKKVLHTGEIGDGKIFIYPVERVVKLRTGEEDRDALL